MSYISEIFERLDIQHIREFLLHGVECVQISEKTYKQRIDDSRKTAIDMIKAKFPDMDEHVVITNEVYGYSSVVEDVYTQIGMQCGAILVIQLLANPKKE